MLKEIKDLSNLISKYYNLSNSDFHYDGRSISFTFNDFTKVELGVVLSDVNVKHSFPNIKKVEIEIDNPILNSNFFFIEEIDFIQRFLISSDFENSTFIIIRRNGEPLVKDLKESYTKEKAIFFSTNYYRKLLQLFSEDVKFRTYCNDEENQFVLTSNNSDSPLLVIGYNKIDTRIKSIDFDLGELYTELLAKFERANYKQLFKERILKSMKHIDTEDIFYRIIQSLRVILNEVELDYEIYIHNFDFSSISKKFKEDRNKYFENLERSLESITKQVSSLPLTFSASAFASYQVKDKPIVMLIIFGVFLIYTFIVLYLLYLSKQNVNQIRNDLDFEEKNLTKFGSKMLAEFTNDIGLVKTKIKRIYNLIYILTATYIILIVIFYTFIQMQYNKSIEVFPQLIYVSKCFF